MMIRSNNSSFITVAILGFVLFQLLLRSIVGGNEIVELVNDSGVDFHVYAVDPSTKELSLILQTSDNSSERKIKNNVTVITSKMVKEGTEVEIRELCGSNNGVASERDIMTCRRAVLEIPDDTTGRKGKFSKSILSDELDCNLFGVSFRVVASYIAVYTVNKHFELVEVSEIQQHATAVVNGIMKGCRQSSNSNASNYFDESCVARRFIEYVAKTTEQLAFESSVREKLADKLEVYSCSDPNLTTSEPIGRTTWADPGDGGRTVRKVDIMHELPASKIHVIQNFISTDECRAFYEAADRSGAMERATVAGGMTATQDRKVMQANIEVPWHQEREGNFIAKVSRRVYDYTNEVLDGLDLREAGQAKLKFLHYSGRGRNDTEPDQYSPHCDSNCSGALHKKGQRVATMVMYW